MGHALVLDTGAGTHFTVVYFTNGKIDAQIIEIAKTYCKDKGLDKAAVEVGPMWGKNSILVNGTLATIKMELTNHFNLLGYQVDLGRRGQTAHININGNQTLVAKMHPQVDLVTGWYGM